MPDPAVTATASVFSGRPDPRWEVSQSLANEFEARWRALPDHEGPRPSPAPLGYRGCTLEIGRVEYAAFGGVVARREGDEVVTRADASRLFERLLLESAPVGTFPPGLLPREIGVRDRER